MPFNDSIYTMTPGSAVAESLQQILQRKRDEQRQAMLDALNKRSVESDISYRTNQTELARQAEQRLGAESQHRMVEDQIDDIWGAQDVSTLSPEIQKRLRETGRTRTETVTPRVGTSEQIQAPEGASPEELEAFAQAMEAGTLQPEMQFSEAGPSSSRETFIGSPEYQKQQHSQQLIQELMKRPEFQGNADVQRWAAGAAAGVNLPDWAARPNTPLYMFDEPSGTVKNTGQSVPTGADVLQRGYPPQPRTPVVIGLQADPNNPTRQNVIQQDANGNIEVVPVPGTGAVDPRPTDRAEQPVIPPTLANAIGVAMTTRGADRASRLQSARANAASQAIGLTPQAKLALIALTNDIIQMESNGRPVTIHAAQAALQRLYPEVANDPTQAARVSSALNIIIHGQTQ